MNVFNFLEKLNGYYKVQPTSPIIIPYLILTNDNSKHGKFAFCNKVYVHTNKKTFRIDLYNHNYESSESLTLADLVRIFGSLFGIDLPKVFNSNSKDKKNYIDKYSVWVPDNTSYNLVKPVSSLTHTTKYGELALLIEN